MDKFAFNKNKNHNILISTLVDLLNCELYLELGIFDGYNIFNVSKYSKRCIGVDISDNRVYKNGYEFHLKTTDDFFKNFNEKPNVIFIDADHKFEQVIIDFENSLKYLSDYGIIILHDTDPITEEYLEPKYCNNSYKIHDYIKENYKDLNVITLPIWIAGITIVNRNNDRRVLNFLKNNLNK